MNMRMHINQLKYKHEAGESFTIPLLASFILIAFLFFIYIPALSEGSLSQYDEYYTLERTTSFETNNDYLTVYSDNQPTFKKPPLQYWLSAALLHQNEDIEFSLRLPSFLFALGVLISAGWLAFVLLPEKPWTIPAAILLVASSTQFWENATSALLDMGASLFFTITLAATILALRQPKWWYVVAAATVLGTLQKAPVPICGSVAVYGAAVLTARWHSANPLSTLVNRHFAIALVIAVAGVAFWPVLQWSRYGSWAVEDAYVREMLMRFSPGKNKAPLHSWFEVITAGEPIPRLVAGMASLALPWSLKRYELAGIPAIFIVYCAAVAVASGNVFPRYTLIILPMLMASVAAVVMAGLPKAWIRALAICIVSASMLGPYKTPAQLGVTYESSQAKFLPLLEDIRSVRRPEETFLVCDEPPDNIIFPGAISYYASAGHPVFRFASTAALMTMQKRGKIHPPYRGLCNVGDLGMIRSSFDGVSIVEEREGKVHFTATNIRTD